IRGDRVVLYYRDAAKYRALFRPTFIGRFRERDGHTVLDGRFRMTLFARALLPIWLAPAIVCLVRAPVPTQPHPPSAAFRPGAAPGYLLALAAGATWGTTGPLSTGLYALMPATSIGFWRVLLGTVCLAAWGLLFYRELFRVDRVGWLLVGLGGGALVALFEVAYQFAIAGAGVAGAAAMLYTAPVIVAILARWVLKEALTPVRLLLS